MEMTLKLWMCLVVKVKSDAVKITNQGKLDMVKQAMARVNTDVLGISELKWMGMGKFNSGDQSMYYCGQESLRRNGVAFIVKQKIPKCSTLVQLQNGRMISVCFQGEPFNIIVIQGYVCPKH